MIPLLCELLKPLSDFVPTQVANRGVRKWEQIHLGAQRGSKLPNISGPWFPHLESEGGWDYVSYTQVFVVTAGQEVLWWFSVICIVWGVLLLFILF